MAPEDLARRVARNVCEEDDLARTLVVRQSLSDEIHEFFLELVRSGAALAQDDKRAGNLASLVVSARNDSAVTHGGMLHQDGFDLGRRDGKALVLDHLLAAVDDVVE